MLVRMRSATVAAGAPTGLLLASLPDMLRQLPAVLGPERVAVLADQARVCFHAAT